jgi:DNA polymerase-3 subunit epsilon
MDRKRLQEIVETLGSYNYENEAGSLTNCTLYKELQRMAWPQLPVTYPEQLSKPLVFLDIESTGTDVQQDRIVEICILKYYGGPKWEDLQVRRLNPTIPIPKAASDVHGITDAMVKDSPTFRHIAKSLLEIIAGCDIVGYNSNAFDCAIMFFEFERAGLYWEYENVNLIDVGNIFKIQEDRTLSSAVKFYLGNVHDQAHTAGGDVIVTKDIFFQQLARYTDIPKHYAELALYSNYNRKIIDISGKFTFNAEGEIVFTFGQHKDKPVRENVKYMQWMIDGGSFNSDTKKVAAKLIFQYGSKK